MINCWRLQVNWKDNWIAICTLDGEIIQVNSVAVRHMGLDEKFLQSLLVRGKKLHLLLQKQVLPDVVQYWIDGNETQRLVDEDRKRVLVRMASPSEATMIWIQLIRSGRNYNSNRKRIMQEYYASSSEYDDDDDSSSNSTSSDDELLQDLFENKIDSSRKNDSSSTASVSSSSSSSSEEEKKRQSKYRKTTTTAIES